MFDASKFTTRTMSPWDFLRQMRAVVDGVHPLDGWKHQREGSNACPVSLVKKDNMVVVIVPARPPACDEYYVTTYWDADPQEVRETVQGTRGFCKFSKEGWTWSGGTETMCESRLFDYLANGAE
jgi:hypothetical protein